MIELCKGNSSKRKVMGKYVRRKVTFRVKAPVGASVFVAGTFNDWNPEARRLADPKGCGEFSCIMYLMRGQYEYKFIINGVWVMDADNPEFVANDKNSMNSIFTIE